jgi:hypothetical protein
MHLFLHTIFYRFLKFYGFGVWECDVFPRFIHFLFIYVMPVYNLLRKGAMSKSVRSGTCGDKASKINIWTTRWFFGTF